ncbi:MAG: RelA/SpoT family protein [Gammaproteobacteria bacterium]|nr:RelA/SpoT family protein [Gammaproteobacteria bacterium]
MLHTFNTLRAKLEKYLDVDQIEQVYDAYIFANRAHKDQLRVSGEPYITHPLEVCCILADLKLDLQSILTALLHDVLEDTNTKKSDLIEKYGETVAELVDGVSKLKHLNFSTRAEAQAENLRKMMLAMVRDIRVIIIKMADRLHNMQTLGALKPQKRRRIARETLEIYAPIANRLGMYYFKTAFENYGFDHLHPMRSRVLREQVSKQHRVKLKLIDEIQKNIKVTLTAAGINNHKIIGREKNIYSIYKKMKNKRIPFNEIMDIYAFRIEVATQDDCYRALGLMHALFKPVPNKFKDYIAVPKINGYQALHTVLRGPDGVPVEIQIRTYEMGNLAENGVAAHWLYKSADASITTAQVRAREWFSSLLEMQNSAGNSLEFIENVKIDLFPHELYVFTPKGDVIKLQADSTAVDFAYAVHTDIGNTCVATRIDNRLVPLSTILENGQTVEIITAKGARPNPAWLSFVQSGKAQSNIRHFLKFQKEADMHSLGKKMLDSALKDININIQDVPKPTITRLLKECNLNSLDELYQDTGVGNRLAFLIAKRLTELLNLDNKLSNENINKPIAIQGTEGMAISFAECCYPIPGDAIVGVFIEDKGLEVHTSNCKNHLTYKKYKSSKSDNEIRRDMSNQVQLCWADDCKGLFKVKIIVDVANKRGMLAEMAIAISGSKANIEKITTEDQDGGLNTLITMLLGVKDNQNLFDVIRNLRKIKYVNKVSRYEQQ